MNAFLHRLAPLGRRLGPIWIGLIILSLCLYQGRRERKYRHKKYQEAFPLSHYPMYSGFDPFDYYVYVADGQGQPLALNTETGGQKSNALKKIYDKGLESLPGDLSVRTLTPAQAKPVGEKVLANLVKTYPRLAQKPALRLYQVAITIGPDDRPTETAPALIAEWKNPTSTATPNP
jgi:hypothetical protein